MRLAISKNLLVLCLYFVIGNTGLNTSNCVYTPPMEAIVEAAAQAFETATSLDLSHHSAQWLRRSATTIRTELRVLRTAFDSADRHIDSYVTGM